MDDLIYLESDEEITSVIDKLRQTDSKSVGLVIPKGASIIQSVVNLKLIQKEAENLEKTIAIISQDTVGRNLAGQIGLTVYESVKSSAPIVEMPKPVMPVTDVIEIDLSEVKKEPTPKGVKVNRYDDSAQPAKESAPTHIVAKPIAAEDYSEPKVTRVKKPKNPKKLIIIFSLIIAGLILFGLYYPKAFINLTLKTTPFEKNIDITLDNNIQKADPANSTMPGDLQEVTNDQTKEFSATGKKETGDKATGKITAYNEWDSSAHNYPAGTKFTTGDKTFVSNSAFTIPASSLSAGKIQPGTVEVSVTADQPGDSYNIGASTFSVADAPAQIYGKSAQSMAGGSTKYITIVSQDDINNSKVSLQEELVNKNKSDIIKKAGDQKIIESSIENSVVSFSSDKNAGEEADKFKSTMKLKSRTLSFSENDFREFLSTLLAGQIPAGQVLAPTTTNEISISQSENDFNQGVMKLTGTIKTSLAPQIDENSIKQAIAGKSKFDAEQYLSTINGVDSESITFRPSWWIKKIPTRLNNIQINLTYSSN